MCDDTGVRIGVLCPGMVLTDMTEDMKQREKDRTYLHREEEHIHLARGWTPYVYKALRPRQNGCYRADAILTCIFPNKN